MVFRFGIPGTTSPRGNGKPRHLANLQIASSVGPTLQGTLTKFPATSFRLYFSASSLYLCTRPKSSGPHPLLDSSMMICTEWDQNTVNDDQRLHPFLLFEDKVRREMRRILLVEFLPVQFYGKWGKVLEHLVAKVDIVARDVRHNPHHELLRPLLRWRSFSLRRQDLWSSILSNTNGPRRLWNTNPCLSVFMFLSLPWSKCITV